MLWLNIHFPQLPLEIFTRGLEAASAWAVSDGQVRRPCVLLGNEAAVACGVRAGMMLSSAHALVDDLGVRVRDPVREHRALEGLAAWAGQFSSMVSIAPAQDLLIEAGASLSLFGGLDGLMAEVERGLDGLGYASVFAVAPTPLAATWLAHSEPGARITRRRVLRDRLGCLPLAMAGFTSATLRDLRAMGLRTLDDLLRLPRKELTRRTDANCLRLVDKALGAVPDPRPTYRPPARFERWLVLPAEASDSEALLFAGQRLLRELVGVLRAGQGGVQRLDWILRHPDGESSSFSLGMVSPGRDGPHMTLLLQEYLNRHELVAPVGEVGLIAERILPLSGSNADLFNDTASSLGHSEGFLDRLRVRLGDEAIRTLQVSPDHRPERAWAVQPASLHSSGGKGDAFLPLADRPLWLMQQPVPIEDTDLKLESECERIESGWWDGQDVARDYFVARNRRGERFWVFRERRRERQWFVHGVFG